jgi:hypothetical protein
MKLTSALTLSLLFCATASAQAKPAAFTAPDYSGTYQCTGKDDHEGDYTGTVTLALVRSQSTGPYGAYNFKLEVPGYGAYPGHAAARGKDMAIHFALTDQSTKDYGTGIASFTRNKAGKWTFSKYYFEPEFKGGNFGFERCTQQ